MNKPGKKARMKRPRNKRLFVCVTWYGIQWGKRTVVIQVDEVLLGVIV